MKQRAEQNIKTTRRFLPSKRLAAIIRGQYSRLHMVPSYHDYSQNGRNWPPKKIPNARMLHVSMWVSPSQRWPKVTRLYLTCLFDVMCQDCASILNKPIKSDVDNIIPSSYHHDITYIYISHTCISNQYVRIVYSTTWHNCLCHTGIPTSVLNLLSDWSWLYRTVSNFKKLDLSLPAWSCFSIVKNLLWVLLRVFFT